MKDVKGLFNTNVRVEDVDDAIQDQMKTLAKLGKNCNFTVIGDGNGFLSRVILVEPQWTNPENLPSKFILKISSCEHIQNLVAKLKAADPNFTDEQANSLLTMLEIDSKELHNREVNLYKILEKWNMDDVLLSPKVFFSKKFDDENKTMGFIGMEFVEDSVTRHLYQNVQPHELHPVLRSIATLQAKSLNLTEDEMKSIEGYDAKKKMESIMNNDGLRRIFGQTKKINPERLTEKVERLEDLGNTLLNFELTASLNTFVGINQKVLVHGDLWAANILWKEYEEKFSVSKVIDYQVIHFGNPAEDLVRLFLSTLSGADCHNHWEKLIEQFYEYFLEALEKNEPIPYSLEQLKQSYRLFFVSAGLIMLPMFGPVAEAKLSYFSNEQREEYREVLTEKAERLLEDMEKWHFYTLKEIEV